MFTTAIRLLWRGMFCRESVFFSFWSGMSLQSLHFLCRFCFPIDRNTLRKGRCWRKRNAPMKLLGIWVHSGFRKHVADSYWRKRLWMFLIFIASVHKSASSPTSAALVAGSVQSSESETCLKANHRLQSVLRQAYQAFFPTDPGDFRLENLIRSSSPSLWNENKGFCPNYASLLLLRSQENLAMVSHGNDLCAGSRSRRARKPEPGIFWLVKCCRHRGWKVGMATKIHVSPAFSRPAVIFLSIRTVPHREEWPQYSKKGLNGHGVRAQHSAGVDGRSSVLLEEKQFYRQAITR